MTDRKVSKLAQKQPTLTTSKTAVDSSQKKTAPKHRFQDSSQSNRKNLLAEFERAQAQTRAKENRSKIESQAMSSINESSISSSQVIEQIGGSISLKEEDYGYQLPRSYILAMSGLQQAIVQRDLQIKRLTLEYEEEHKIRLQLQAINGENALKIKQNEIKIGQLTTEIKIIKQTAIEERRILVQAQRSRLQLQNQLTLTKQANTIQKDSQQKMFLQMKSQLERVQHEFSQIKKQNGQFKQVAESARKELDETNNRKKQQIQRIESQLKEVREQLGKQRLKRKQADEQIVILKKQAQLLAERTINAENHQQESIIQEAIIRKPLLDIAVITNQERKQSVSRKLFNPTTAQYSEKKAQPQKQAQEIDKKIDVLSSASKGIQHQRKATDGSMLSRDRSSSRLRPRQNCPQLVSQYRQLMRHQKELIGLNYQLQVLEKDMVRQGEGKGDLHKSYQKLRRECQQKEIQIRELKSFLNDPLK